MKKLILLLFCMSFIFACDDGEEILIEPNYSIEGKWIWSPSDNRQDANTMYEFVDGNRYIYYCIICPSDDAYWNSLSLSDALPNTNP